MAKVKAKAKKKKNEVRLNEARPVIRRVVSKEAKPEVEYEFKSRDGAMTVKMSEAVKSNKASEVLFGVLRKGKIPEGLKLQWADSYKAHFINKKGKNACGANSTRNLLVVNGIAEELEAAGVKGIVRPTIKPYKAINLKEYDSDQIRELVDKIAMVLGFTNKGKKETITAELEATKA